MSGKRTLERSFKDVHKSTNINEHSFYVNEIYHKVLYRMPGGLTTFRFVCNTIYSKQYNRNNLFAGLQIFFNIFYRKMKFPSDIYPRSLPL